MQYFLDMYRRYVDFRGRSTRKEFWCAYGIYVAIMFVLQIICVTVGGMSYSNGGLETAGMNAVGVIVYGLTLIIELASFIPMLALEVRRLRDAGYKWWILIICYVGTCACGIGAIALLILLCMPTKNPENMYQQY